MTTAAGQLRAPAGPPRQQQPGTDRSQVRQPPRRGTLSRTAPRVIPRLAAPSARLHDHIPQRKREEAGNPIGRIPLVLGVCRVAQLEANGHSIPATPSLMEPDNARSKWPV